MTDCPFRSSVSIIVLAYNHWEVTRRCLESLEMTIPASWPVELIVVDNASADDTPKLLAEWISRTKLNARAVRLDPNVGVSGGYNAGGRAAGSDICIFMNNDMEALPGWLAPLIHKLESDSNTGVVGARLIYPDGRLQHGGVVLSDRGCPYHIYRGLPGDCAPAMTSREFPGVTGACWAVPRALFNKAGGLDEAYWLGYEDIDFCFKIRELGAKIWYESKSTVIHFERTTVQSTPTIKNMLRFFDKWKPSLRGTHRETYERDGYTLLPLDDFLKRSFESAGANDAIYVFGAGSHTSKLMTRINRTLKSAGRKLTGILDKSAIGSFEGLPVFHPEQIPNPAAARVVLSSVTYELDMEDHLRDRARLTADRIIPLYKPGDRSTLVPNTLDDFYLPEILKIR